MRKPPLSVAIATHNEENNIGSCLESIQDLAGEVVVVDGESTDRTVEIAAERGARVIETTNKPIFHINKQMAVEACRGAWILQLDADERVGEALAAEIRTVADRSHPTQKNNNPAAYWLKRKNLFLGTFLTKGGVYPDPVIRLFQNGKGRFPCRSVHEQIEVDGKVAWLEEDLIHLADPTFTRYLKRNNRYTTLMAKEHREDKLPVNAVTALKEMAFKPAGWFLWTYIRHKGFTDGFPGLVFSLFSSLRFPIAYIKYWEMVRTGRAEIDLTKDWE